MTALTAEQVASFHHDGFLYPIPALSADEIAYFVAGVERLESELGCPVAKPTSNGARTATRIRRGSTS